ncbi:MAG: ATP-binding cassette domain-containing protein [Pseudolysinimonas sp.]|uniref:ABC transporter ATP-binding protein n=1 Tax=Pseudolysinimonas sp. TaxID=2680009 RepID=UPI003C722D98
MGSRLTLENVSLLFGGVHVLEEVSFVVEPGSVVGLVGPNGAGKTSLFNCISGHYRASAGSIRIDDSEVLGLEPAKLAKHGLARTFQHPALRLEATVLDNVLLGAHTRSPGTPMAWALRMPGTVRAEHALRAEALERLDRVGLGWAADIAADELSHGLHKSIELARALMLHPTLLLLDEPAAGLSHGEVDQFISNLKSLRTEEITVIVVEHNMSVISQVTDQVVVLDHGKKLMEGTAAAAQSDPRVIEAYLGAPDAA